MASHRLLDEVGSHSHQQRWLGRPAQRQAERAGGDLVYSGAEPYADAAKSRLDNPIPHPIANTENLPKSYKSINVDRTSAMGEKLNAEPLVDVHKYGIAGDNYYAREGRPGLPASQGGNPPYDQQIDKSGEGLRLRESVAKSLQAVNKDLAKYGLEANLLSGHRSIETQSAIFDHFKDDARGKLREQLGKDPTEEQVEKAAKQFASDPRGFDKDKENTWPTATTGGTVELTLRKKGTKEQVNMGEGKFDDSSPTTKTAYYEDAQHQSSRQEREARDNRRILFNVMKKHGFTGNPNMWYHFSKDNQEASLNQMRYGEDPQPAYYGAI